MLPEILEALLAARTPVSVLTKSPLVMRDVEIFERFRDAGLRVSVKPRCRPWTRRRGGRPSRTRPARRRGWTRWPSCAAQGDRLGVLIAPLMPGINDSPDQVEPIVARAREAGATFLGGVALHLRGEVKDVFFGWLQSKRPDLLPEYERLYGRRAYMRPEDRKRTTRALRGWGQRSHADLSRTDRGDSFSSPEERGDSSSSSTPRGDSPQRSGAHPMRAGGEDSDREHVYLARSGPSPRQDPPAQSSLF